MGRFENLEEIYEIAQQLIAAPEKVVGVMEKYERPFPQGPGPR